MRLSRVFLGLMLLAVLAGAAWAYRLLHAVSGGAPPAELIRVVRDPEGFFPRNRVNVLIVGKDYNYTRQDIAYSKNARSDTIMLLSLDLQSGSAAAVSVPRDTYVQATDGIEGKINGTFARGGVELLKQTLERTFGVHIDHYVILKDTAVKHIVDALGGVWVETIDAMRYDDSWGHLHIDLPKGRQFINGEQAVGFVRFRKSNQGAPPSKEEGDIRRTERQQQLLRAMAEQALQPSNLLRLDQIVNVALGEIETDLSRPQMMAIAARMGRQSLNNLRTATLPGTGGTYGGVYLYYLDREKAQALVDWLIKGDPTAGNRLVEVSVLNASDRGGVARATAGLLRQQGFSIQRADTARERQETSTLIYKQAALEPQARTIQQLLHIPKLEKNPDYPVGGDVVLLVGNDLSAAMLERWANQ
ncbi:MULTISPECIES: LCP family protein [unclassified Meiothermus]|uniref:LCP family protein n=1 Tax=unclassified Meiothermus TaxID=370471 RepID=UPI000D7BCB31|nr:MULTISPECIES: LCP family protein [unclassified Meiothermus]PZA07902.1 LytR family transcriptional regulator [Meiothermus sp. Pnk-1]RYM38786.1 LytR family transcriptional regulator [Meiothermus sp. PNK-Is4]